MPGGVLERVLAVMCRRREVRQDATRSRQAQDTSPPGRRTRRVSSPSSSPRPECLTGVKGTRTRTRGWPPRRSPRREPGARLQGPGFNVHLVHGGGASRARNMRALRARVAFTSIFNRQRG
ncbi:hypothetical protein TMEN_4155, partial [Trichophyton mentagrophytes]